MLNLLERNIDAIDNRLLLLTPGHWPLPNAFRKGIVDKRKHSEFLRQMQRMRGEVYVRDGAIKPTELSRGGLHRTAQDDKAWHLLMLDEDQKVTGCIWYLEHDTPVAMDDLRVRTCPLAGDGEWGHRVRRAVDAEIDRADRKRLAYGEVGGWAVSQHHRPADGLLLVVACYSLIRVLGNALGVTMATTRHSSATILRRIGLARFEVDGQILPLYHDPKYDCEMELLRFDTEHPSPQYEHVVEAVRERLPYAATMSATSHVSKTFGFPYPVYGEAVVGAA
jgi:hypothetical protein